MRQVNPVDLEQLAKLLDGKDHTSLDSGLDEAFQRASTLGVSSKLGAIRPLGPWVTTNAPDLRRRAGLFRATGGDLSGGLLWAGFTPEEMAKTKAPLSAEDLLLANSVATSEDPKAYEFQRKGDESLDDWIDRLKAHALLEIPGLDIPEATLTEYVKLYGDVTSTMGAAKVVTVQGTAMTITLGGNALKTGLTASPLGTRMTTLAQGWKTGANPTLRWLGTKMIDPQTGLLKEMPIRSLSAPGTWLPGKLAGVMGNSAEYQRVAGIPGTGGFLADRWGSAWNAFRRGPYMNSPLFRSVTPNNIINGIVGSDDLAKTYGGLTHSGQEVSRAAQANLFRVGRNAANAQRYANELMPAAKGASPFLRGVTTATRAGGFLRTGNVALSAVSTGFDVANLVSQGNPVNAFKRDKLGYAGDVAQTAFDATMTAALIAPNPITIGLAVGTGLVYGTIKVVEHWDDIKAGTKKAGEAISNTAKNLAGGAKDFAKKHNPFHW